MDKDSDDLIELNGLNMTSVWQFPKNINRCPSRNCIAAFKSRSDLLAHYRLAHAPNNFLCPGCEKPICAANIFQVFKHFQNAHKNMEIPPEFTALIPQNEEDDLIQLNGGNLNFYT